MKRGLILLSILSVIATGLFAGCQSSSVNGEDNTSGSNYLLDIGYENCLICHTGDRYPLNLHCLILDPITHIEIYDESYSPKLSDCLLCHLSHANNPDKITTTLNCGECHLEYQ